ncbi:bifunctional DNA-formamidopyrimidine glycosylase/DNA-(apurinic or apyrimidinic site) lyase [Cryobacterium adonitolivorans]|uniref:Bifunctional DNA-formamidopyrimidine glycosylase/DNA-(Apurinic or apyrimidinic site) lyase n=1 Tax=Cryobacterium adonitolivorans TaxID=1259189 RepID=A0A4R8W1F6_9MICO|nr:bifunctional DNA-formamidopyrimidine glycosylase/DNA-(apurinic or apyrimidinic site) lyase [Cryobacterium adonitolivorans]TFB96227.1 bifunctional DNA-formamidopyrimidine glycosylase/DNA-(apurinic or apyrimidinic site) lyase [Cryobacterium adonitolivorans]
MPELPEVEVVRAGLESAVSGAIVTGVEIFDERSLRRHDRSLGDFEALLTGARIEAAVRRGKFLWFPLAAVPGEPPGTAERRAIVAHLGMSGQVLLRTPGETAQKLLRIRLTLQHPEQGELALHFVDQRIFGSMAVDRLQATVDGRSAGYAGPGMAPGRPAAGETDTPPAWSGLIPSQVAHIGRDPLDPAFSAPAFYGSLARTRSGIKRVLLDQQVVSGIGNIYADEALFDARVHFDQPAASLSPASARRLLTAVRAILLRALDEGGTSFDAQYVNVNGQSGYFAHSLNAYGQQGKPCPRCGTDLVRAKFMNRSSHYCPRCQRVR